MNMTYFSLSLYVYIYGERCYYSYTYIYIYIFDLCICIHSLYMYIYMCTCESVYGARCKCFSTTARLDAQGPCKGTHVCMAIDTCITGDIHTRISWCPLLG